MSTQTDSSDIQALLRRMTDAWNAGDATAYAEQFTPDAQYISWLGSRDEGRAAIEATHRFLFAGPLRGVRLGSDDTTASTDLRFLGSDVALVIVDGGKPDHTPTASVITLVAVRTAEGWRFGSFQNTRKTQLPTG